MTSTPEAKMREALEKIVPKIGWRGNGSDPQQYYCEFCGAHHEDYDYSEHAAGCPVPIAREALSLPSGWQPIESAPEQTMLLLYGKHSRGGADQCLVGCKIDDVGGWQSAEDGYGLYLSPTHWMPLPETPALSKETEHA